MDLWNVLQEVSALTGWEVYLEPGTSSEASAKFKNLPRNDALRRLLGKLNFELSPQSNSVPKLFVFRTGAGNATQRIGAEKKSVVKVEKDKPIPNHLIVTLKPGSKISIEVLAQQLGAKVIGKLDGLNAYLLEFSDEAAANAAREQLLKASEIASVDSNFSMEKPAPFNMASVNASSPFNLKASATGGDGNNIVVGLIDTAIQQLGENMQGFLLPQMSAAGEFNLNSDVPTHGTTMAESILLGANSMIQSGQGTSSENSARGYLWQGRGHDDVPGGKRRDDGCEQRRKHCFIELRQPRRQPVFGAIAPAGSRQGNSGFCRGGQSACDDTDLSGRIFFRHRRDFRAKFQR